MSTESLHLISVRPPSIVFKICSVKNKVLKRLYTIFFPCLGSDLFFANIPFLCFCIIISNLWYVGEYALLTLPDSLSILLHTAPWIQDAHVDGYHAREHLCWLSVTFSPSGVLSEGEHERRKYLGCLFLFQVTRSPQIGCSLNWSPRLLSDGLSHNLFWVPITAPFHNPFIPEPVASILILHYISLWAYLHLIKVLSKLSSYYPSRTSFLFMKHMTWVMVIW